MTTSKTFKKQYEDVVYYIKYLDGEYESTIECSDDSFTLAYIKGIEVAISNLDDQRTQITFNNDVEEAVDCIKLQSMVMNDLVA